jgi:peptidoglycan hydrolase CwlO-like protein
MSNFVNDLISCGIVAVNLGVMFFAVIAILVMNDMDTEIRELKKQIKDIQTRFDEDESIIRYLAKNLDANTKKTDDLKKFIERLSRGEKQ